MSLSPTRSGGSPARIAVASWLVSSLGDVTCITIFKFLCVALNSGINYWQPLARVPDPERHRTLGVDTERRRPASSLWSRRTRRGLPVRSSTIAGPTANATRGFTITTPHGEPPSFEGMLYCKVILETRWRKPFRSFFVIVSDRHTVLSSHALYLIRSLVARPRPVSPPRALESRMLLHYWRSGTQTRISVAPL